MLVHMKVQAHLLEEDLLHGGDRRAPAADAQRRLLLVQRREELLKAV